MAEGTGGQSGPAAGTPTSNGKAAPNGKANGAAPLNGTAANENHETAANDNQEAAQPYRFRTKLKVDGKEEDVDLSEDDIRERLQRQRAYEKKEKQYRDGFAEIDRVRAALGHLHTQPLEVLQALGVDRKALAEMILEQEAKQAAMTPEQRLLAERDARIAELEEARRQQQEEYQKAQQKMMDEALWQESQPRIIAALEATGVPPTPEVLRMYAQVGRQWLDRGYEAPEAVIAQEAVARLRADADGFYQGLPVEKLIERLGPKTVSALMQHVIQKSQAGRAARKTSQPVSNGHQEKRDEPAYVDEAEFRKRAGL